MDFEDLTPAVYVEETAKRLDEMDDDDKEESKEEGESDFVVL